MERDRRLIEELKAAADELDFQAFREGRKAHQTGDGSAADLLMRAAATIDRLLVQQRALAGMTDEQKRALGDASRAAFPGLWRDA